VTVAPKTGEYIVGDSETDGHTHKFVVGVHHLDEEFPDEVDPNLISGDFPRATTSDPVNSSGNHIHAHSIRASTTEDETLICDPEGPDSNQHTHTKFTKVVQ